MLQGVLREHASELFVLQQVLAEPTPRLRKALDLLALQVHWDRSLDPLRFPFPADPVSAGLDRIRREHLRRVLLDLDGPELRAGAAELMPGVTGPEHLMTESRPELTANVVLRMGPHAGRGRSLPDLLMLLSECAKPGFHRVDASTHASLAASGRVGDSAPLLPEDPEEVIETALALSGTLAERLAAARALEA
jgi:hypothetical protein